MPQLTFVFCRFLMCLSSTISRNLPPLLTSQKEGFARDEESPQPWRVQDLASPTKLLKDSETFYPAATFRLDSATATLPLPHHLLLSENHAPALHTNTILPRRLRNVILLLEWTAPAGATLGLDVSDAGGDAEADTAAAAAARAAVTAAAVATATGRELVTSSAEVDDDAAAAAAASVVDGVDGPSPMTVLVCLSLEEAVAVRRAIHAGDVERAGVSAVLRTLSGRYMDIEPQPSYSLYVLQQAARALTLLVFNTWLSHLTVCLPCRAARTAQAAVAAPPLAVALQAARFFNCCMWYTRPQVILLLRALAKALPLSRRVAFFERIIGARRRDRLRWAGTELATAFATADEGAFLALEVAAAKVRAAVAERFDSLLEAFQRWVVIGASSLLVVRD